MQDQSTIRKHIQSLRQALSDSQQQKYSEEICQQVTDSQMLNQAKRIAIYLPVRGEADPTLLMQQNELPETKFYLPVLSPTAKNHLAFAEYNTTTKMKLNRFKIPEPDVRDGELLHDPSELDCVIMPLVGVDLSGNRIGMGGGFYDRTFAFRKAVKQAPLLIGFCYDFQITTQQTPQEWDVPVDVITTQSSFEVL